MTFSIKGLLVALSCYVKSQTLVTGGVWDDAKGCAEVVCRYVKDKLVG